jgi:predicted alpha/beta-hydrolase family hydrolase
MDALILTHGAGSNRNAPLLLAVDRRISEAGVRVVRVDLAFREERPGGPPRPGDAARDRAGLKAEVEKQRASGAARVFLGGQSYGGRQATMLAAEEPGLVHGLLLLSYPLHAPRRASELRTAHFPAVRTAALFVHGSRDPFGRPDELEEALKLIPAPVKLAIIEGAGHDLKRPGVEDRIAAAFTEMFTGE